MLLLLPYILKKKTFYASCMLLSVIELMEIRGNLKLVGEISVFIKVSQNVCISQFSIISM